MNVIVPPGTTNQLSSEDFRRVTAIALREAGLSIPDAKRSMVQSRLNRRLRALGLSGFSSYLDLVESKDGEAERPHMISALTTNVTHFFREDHHFQTLRQDILPDLARRGAAGERIRIWSAGCSAGQEPYSIAMTVAETAPELLKADLLILGTDIDRRILSVARAGQYHAREMSGVPEALRGRYFSQNGEDFTIKPLLRDRIRFRELNLIRPWPMNGPFHVIFCRNVLIYFSEETQRQLWPSFARLTATGGTMFLGHSERMHDHETHGFSTVGVTTYRKS